ncbi:MAG: methyltransferase domain-containing protein [Flavobacteriales bacterium]|nr:methyltransferase domain-containing protein [Flavobacteriales bacterium]
MNPLQFLRLLFKGPTPQQMAAQLRKPHGFMARKVGERMNAVNRSLYQGAWEALDLRDGMRVLEIGFGNGRFFGELIGQAKDLKLHGLDFSKEMVEQASAQNAALIANGTLSLSLGPSDRMPYPDALFDRIFCINVVYFWEDPATHLGEVRRVLKPGGTFITVLRTRSSMEKLPFADHGFTKYEKVDWEQVLRANGFIPSATTVLREAEVEFLGSRFTPESLVMTASVA